MFIKPQTIESCYFVNLIDGEKYSNSVGFHNFFFLKQQHQLIARLYFMQPLVFDRTCQNTLEPDATQRK